MKCKLTPQLSSDDWKDFCSRFHFSPADLPYIKAIYTALLPLVESCAYYSLDQNLDGIFLPHYAYGFVTLGNGIDELSELYLDHEQIQEAYIVDCVSLLLLSKAYAEFAHVIEDQSGLSLAELSFLGDTYSLDLLPQSMNALRRMRSVLPKVRCFCPSKQLRLSCIWIQIHTQISDNYVIPAQPVRIFPVLPENLLCRICHILMVPCRYSI